MCDLKVKDPWRERLAYFADILGAYQPDIACLQELITKKEAVEELGGMAPLANHTRIFYEGGLLADPDATLYVDEAKFRVEDSGVFWLSPEPDRPFSTGFAHHGAQEPRVFVWATLREAASGGTRGGVRPCELPLSPSYPDSHPDLYEYSKLQTLNLMQRR